MSFQPAGRVPEPLVVRAGGDDVPPQRRRGVPYCSLIGLAAQGRGNARSCAVSSAWRPGVCPKRYARACPRHYFSATYTLPGGRRRRHTGRPPFPYTVLLPTVASVSISSRHRRSSTPTVNDPRTHCGDLQDGSRLDAQSVSVLRRTLPPRMGFICFKYNARTAPQSVQSRSGE